MTVAAPKYSPQQINAIDFVKNPTKRRTNLMIQAVAGSGKTFTLLQLLMWLDGQVAFMAFSRDIRYEIEGKVEKIKDQLKCNVRVGTVHSFGRSPLVKVYPNTRTTKNKREKADLLMDAVVDPKTGEKGVPGPLRNFVARAYILARQWGIGLVPEFKFGDKEAWYNLVDHFDMEEELIPNADNPPPNLDELVRQGCNWAVHVIKLGIKMAPEYIDFEDMIYLPLYLNLKMWQYDTVLVDECQDLNTTRRMFAGKVCKAGGRLIFVGDPHQAIFGFTGADSDSIANIIKQYNCTTLPLTYSFRCPQSVVRYVQRWVSHIQAAPDAPEGLSPLDPGGVIADTDLWKQELNTTDAILCRNNAPLVDLFFQCIVQNIPAHIEGKDIGADLVKMLKKFPNVKGWDALKKALDKHKTKEVKRLTASGKEEKAGRIADVVEAVLTIMEHMPPTSLVKDIVTKINDMFSDTPDGKKPATLTLTTSHKAKGREWNRVFWYGRNRWNPSPFARQAWQMDQETNLMYVAGTRARQALIEVTVPIPPRRG